VLLDRFFAVVDVGSKVALVHVFLFGELPAFVDGDEFFPALFGGGAVLGRAYLDPASRFAPGPH